MVLSPRRRAHPLKPCVSPRRRACVSSRRRACFFLHRRTFLFTYTLRPTKLVLSPQRRVHFLGTWLFRLGETHEFQDPCVCFRRVCASPDRGCSSRILSTRPRLRASRDSGCSSRILSTRPRLRASPDSDDSWRILSTRPRLRASPDRGCS